MSLVVLSNSDREQLQQLVHATHSARVLRRAQALLAVADGEPVKTVAQRERVGISTVYEWVHRYREGDFGEQVLGDAPRSGRPPKERRRVAEILTTLMERAPGAFGYRHTVWTVPLLLHHLKAAHDLVSSPHTVRRALHDLGYRWKRPRFVLSRRHRNWRQVKGGSSED